MIQVQYYNKGLTKTQIEQILNNYKLKYTTLTNEINSKLNSLIKTILKDISPFLENIESISKDLKSLKEMDNHKKKIELLENKLREKSQIEHKLQNDIISLKKEITTLKEKKINQNDSSDNLLKRNVNHISPKKPNKLRKNTFDFNNIDDHSQSVSSEPKSSKRYNNKKTEENSSKSITCNIHSNSIINKKEREKNKYKSNYMMNMKEITRSIDDSHNQIKTKRNTEKISKFISYLNKKINKKETRNKIGKNDKKSKSIDLSNSIDTITKNKKLNNTNELILKDYNIYEEDIEDEINELEIDEESILKLIEDIQNFQNNKEII